MHQNEFLLAQIRGHHRLLVNQWMINRQAEKKFFAKERFGLDVRVVGHITNQGEIDLVLFQIAHQLSGGLFMKD